uniref:Peroxisomal membrane protein 4 n=1 Tax=Panagrolaimus sp. JU765 TaxID=591449 RepID=A0AC34RIF2_9BILA
MEISLQNAELIANYFLFKFRKHQQILAAFKGLRNGLVYGTRIRAPHALVMVFLFGSGTISEKFKTVLQLTKTHAFNLGKFVFGYKLGLAMLSKWQNGYRSWHSFVSAFIVGYYVFGENNGVNTQINLYLLSRIIYGLVKLAVEKQIIREPQSPVFPWFAAFTWGIVLWLFETYPQTLQNSLQSSMSYLYKDSNVWTNFRNFLVFNK